MLFSFYSIKVRFKSLPKTGANIRIKTIRTKNLLYY
nr:MAG TPA: hypothetical protein [Caudoviricetes sp.]